MPRTLTFQPSPYLRRKIEELVESGEFSSQSQLINTALAEWFKDYERNKQRIADAEDLIGRGMPREEIRKRKESEEQNR